LAAERQPWKAKNHDLYDLRDLRNHKMATMHEKGQNLGPQAKSPVAVFYGYASKWAKNGRRSGLACPLLAALRRPCAARTPCFLGESCDAALILMRAARGDINESAEI
jgi:hypothetical protein